MTPPSPEQEAVRDDLDEYALDAQYEATQAFWASPDGVRQQLAAFRNEGMWLGEVAPWAKDYTGKEDR